MSLNSFLLSLIGTDRQALTVSVVYRTIKYAMGGKNSQGDRGQKFRHHKAVMFSQIVFCLEA